MRVAIQFFSKLVSIVVITPLSLAIECFWKVRITPLFCARFGSLAMHTHLYVADCEVNGSKPRTTRIFFGGDPCNRQLFEMWKRRLPIIESRFFWMLFQYSYEILINLPMFRPLPGPPLYDRRHHLLLKATPPLKLSDDDEKRGEDLLHQMGLSEDDWFVCFQARDAADSVDRSGTSARTHRNCDIATYMRAAEYVVSRGGFAIRLGHLVERPLPEDRSPRIIDYPISHRTDFGDVFLLAKCRFLLGSATGTVNVAPLFGTPIALANVLPYILDPAKTAIFTPKLIRENDTGRILHFREAIDYLGGAKVFASAPAEIDWATSYVNEKTHLVDQSADQILDLCMDMFDLLEGRSAPEGAEVLQEQMSDILFSESEDRRRFHPHIAPRFALEYRHLIES